MIAENRREQLRNIIRQRKFVSLPQLAESLSVSESTVRRDLDKLRQSGEIFRTHGGAYATNSDDVSFPFFDSNLSKNVMEKKNIAKKAAELIESGQSILLDGGTTTYLLAQELIGRQLSVVTGSLPIVDLLSQDVTCDLIVVGGNLCRRTGVCQGPVADRMLNQIHVHKAIMSVAAVSDSGFYNHNLLLVETERAIMRSADQVIIIVDSTKFGQQSLAHVCSLDQVQYIVTDGRISAEWRRKIEKAGVKLIIAGE